MRYDYRIIFGQCIQCNRFKDGNYDFARTKAKLRLGEAEYAIVEKRAEISRRVPHTWTRHELKEIRDDARAKIRELKQVKNYFK